MEHFNPTSFSTEDADRARRLATIARFFLVIAVGLGALVIGGLYEISGGTQGVVYRMNRLTGAVWVCFAGKEPPEDEGVAPRLGRYPLPTPQATTFSASGKRVKSWDEVAVDPAFVALSRKDQASVRVDYFRKMILPQIPAGEEEDAWAAFSGIERPTTGPRCQQMTER